MQAPSRHWLGDLRDRSWRLRCSLLLKARLQNWHLYFFSGAPVLRTAGEELDAIAGGLGRVKRGVGCDEQ